MKKSYLSKIVFLLTVCFFTQYAFANPASDFLKNKAKNYAILYANNPKVDLKAASRELSENALKLGEMYENKYAMQFSPVTTQQCLEVVTNLGLDSNNFLNKAMLGQYKKIAIIDGNIVMMIAGGAGLLTYTVIDKGGYCHKEKSVHDAYWAANIILIGIDDIDMMFS